jgi:molybdopterin converting factor small subunit
VNVKIHGTLKDAATNSCDRVELAEGATVSDLLAAVGLGCRTPALVIADGRAVGPSDCLADGSQVSIFARVSGG